MDLEEIANHERIVNAISYYLLLYIYYPSKFLFKKVMGGMGYDTANLTAILVALPFEIEVLKDLCVMP